MNFKVKFVPKCILPKCFNDAANAGETCPEHTWLLQYLRGLLGGDTYVWNAVRQASQNYKEAKGD